MADWSMKGTYVEACSCEAICPCIVLGDPTEGSCTALLGWKIREGHHSDVQLDGLNVVIAAYAPDNMQKGGWKLALYLDERADDRQRDALQAIFSGAAGGFFANLGPLIGEVAGVRPAAIEIDGEGRRFRFAVEGVGEAEILGIEGQEGSKVQVTGHPFAPVPGAPFNVARSERLRFSDHGIGCDTQGRNGFYTEFAYAA